MKKLIYSWGLMLAATFSLTNCAQGLDNPVFPESEGNFVLVASMPDVKTVNDGLNTKWVSGDQINVFHAPSDTKDYVTDGAFTITDVESGKFIGTITDELDVEEEYDWYVLYPYNENIITPGERTSGYTYIGYSTGLNQTGYNSTASLKESVCPLYGVLKYGGIKPKVEIKHLSSVVAINVTNENDEPLTITTASFTATEDIVGSYYIDITASPVKYTASAANYVKNTAIVNVSGGTALAKGESAILYAAIKPFTAAAGNKLTVSVNGYSKEITLNDDVTFTAGKIKTLNFAYDYVIAPEVEGTATETLTFDVDKVNRLSHSSAEQVWFQNGITFTNTKGSSTTNVADYGNPVRLYKGSTITVSAPGNITKIVFNSAANDGSDAAKQYFNFLKTAVGTNEVDGTKVTVKLDGTSSEVTYEMPGQVRLYDIAVTYVGAAYVPPTLESISIEGYKTTFTKNDTFEFGGTATALYDDGSSRDVTKQVTFTGYNMLTVGKQTVTVKYEDKTVEYEIEVKEPEVTEGPKQYTFTITKDDFNTTSYAANNNEKTSTAKAADGSTMTVKWTSYQVMNQSSTMQWQKSKGYIYNSTNLSTIDNIEVTSTAGTFTVYKGTSAQPTSNGSGGYFKINVGSATGKVTSIKVTFTK